MDEFEFIEHIRQKTYHHSSLLRGIGDDAAVFQLNQEAIVTAVDTFVENIHFQKDTISPSDIGYRALAANLSDLAAMGAEPMFYLASIVVSDSWSSDEIKDIFSGLDELAEQFQIDLIGGDTVSGSELVLSITVIGKGKAKQLRYRHDAKTGDIVFVTGTLGDARAGLHILLEETSENYPKYLNLIKKHQRPTPRVTFANKLASIGRIALNDVSDGIANEAYELAKSSHVDIHLLDEKIPVQSKLYHHFTEEQVKRWKYFGGEDFELLGTVSEEEWPIVQAIAEESNLLITKIGKVSHVLEQNPTVRVLKEGHWSTLQQLGYTHLK